MSVAIRRKAGNSLVSGRSWLVDDPIMEKVFQLFTNDRNAYLDYVDSCHQEKSAEWELWAEMLLLGIEDYRKGVLLVREDHHSSCYYSAVQWLFGPDDYRPVLPSFAAVCEILGIDRDYIRRELKNGKGVNRNVIGHRVERKTGLH